MKLPDSRFTMAAVALALAVAAITTRATLPPGWSDADIGSPGQAGSATFSNGLWTIAGGGADIWGTADEFNFASEPFSGDGTIVVRVESETNTDPWAKAGVMFRNDTTAGSMHAAVVATPGNGVSFQWRNTNTGQCSYSAVASIVPPVWVKLVRSANTFSAYYSPDGLNWFQVGSDQVIALNNAALAGLAVCAHTNALLNTATFDKLVVAPAMAVLTQRNDIGRTGQNTNENVLTLLNVNSNTFGRLFTYAVDGNIYAQPLVMTNVSVPGKGVHRVVFVATEHDSVYAFDAESNAGTNAAALWQTSFINPGAGVTTIPSAETSQPNIVPEVGITATPVIDPVSATIYVEVRTKEVSGGLTNYPHRLHALDITTGLERTNFNSPVLITSTNYPGTGQPGYADNDGAGHVLWNPLREHCRPGLLLVNGVVYAGYASPGDHSPYHGWLFGYDAHTLAQTGAFNTTPNGGLGGIWQSGSGLCADSAGYVYVETGNGSNNPSLSSYGDSILKLAATNGLILADYFTPYNQAALDAADQDLDSGGSVVLPDSVGSPAHPHLLLGASKSGNIYLLDRDNLGHFNASNNNQIVQYLPAATGGMWNTPASFNGQLYYIGSNDRLKAFSISAAAINPTPVGQGSAIIGHPGSSPAISASGTNNAIVWALQNDGSNGGQSILHAYNATNVSQELYNSSQTAARDNPGGKINFTVPTIANGKVYMGCASSLSVFGNAIFLPPPLFAPPNGLFTNSVSVTLTQAMPGAAIFYTLDGSTPTTNSSRYTGPLTFSNSVRVTAIASEPSAVTSLAAGMTYLNALSVGTGNGLLGKYYSDHFSTNAYVGTPTLVRTDAVVNFNWGTGSPDPSISSNYFTVRWTGMVQPQFTETFTFYTKTDDGARLYVNNQLLIDKWVNQAATEWSGSIALRANETYGIVLEYFQNTGVSSAVLSWSSPSAAKAVMPESQLYAFTNGLPVFFSGPDSLTNGSFQLQLSGNAGKSYILQGTTDFTNWTPISTSSASYSRVNLADPAASNFPARFYRAQQSP